MKRAIWVLVGLALFVVVGISWAFATPPLSSGDDDFHVTSIVCSREDSPFCEVSETGRAVVPALITGTPCYQLDPSRGADCFRWKPETTETTRYNGAGGDRSPIYYEFMALFLGNDLWRSLLVMRVVNVGIAGLLLATAFLVGSSVRRRALGMSIVAVLFPIGIFHVASKNPTSWAVAGLSVYWLFLLEAWSGGSRSKRLRAGLLGLAGLAGAIAVIGRGDSAIYLVASTLAVLVLRWRWVVRNPVWLLPVGAVAVVAVLLGLPRLRGAWTLVAGNLFNFESLLFEWWPRFHLFEWPLLVSYIVGGATPRYMPYNLWYTVGVGWDFNNDMKIAFPSIVGILGLVVFSGAVWLGLRHYTLRKLVAGGIVLLTIFAMSFGWVFGLNFSSWAQARYYTGPMMILVGLLSLGFSSEAYLRRAQGLLFWLLATIATTAGLMAVVRRTTNGQALAPDVAWNVYEAYVQWWWPDLGVPLPVSPNMVVIIGGVASASLIGLVLTPALMKPASSKQAARSS